MDLSELRAANLARAPYWSPLGLEVWTPLEWAGAMCGEAGEAANVAKKMRQLEQGIPTREGERELVELTGRLGEELADTLIYLDLLAARCGIDLSQAVRAKFNATSDEFNMPVKL
jgi:NTP pyrophosphatase (non-canonical NTP hydrolase)